MTNPFEAFNISDDDEPFQPAHQQQDQKVKRTHQEKRLYKQQQEAAKNAPAQPQPPLNDAIPERVRDNAKDVRDKRAPPTPYVKKLGEGHYHDRRSGTGRVDKPRKEGGGWGNVGNLKDELNKDKYVKDASEGETQQEAPAEPAKEEAPVEPKPEEPQALTLEEYYKSKGVEVSNQYEKKAVSKKADLNAEWIKKEKLTVLESKEDKKISERNSQNIVKFASSRVGLDENLEGLGFFEKKAPKRQEEPRERKHEGRHGKKPVVREEDFPSL